MLWILIAVLFVLLLLFLLACLCLHAAFGVRCEGNPDLKYLTKDDFDDLEARPVSFPSNQGQRLCGAVYTCRGVEPEGLVVFAHGMGGGHLSYTTEIHTLARAGFAVLAYDNTGTMASQGKALGSFYQAVKDLRAALRFVGGEESLKGYKIVLAGHSWGGYTVCQALAFAQEQVAGAVAFSPPDSAARVICENMEQMAGIPLGFLRPFLWLASVVRGGWQSRRSCSAILRKTDRVPVLLLQGDSDTAVSLKNSPVSRPDLRDKENITAVLYEGRGHNVYQTKESERYLAKTFAAIGQAQKRYGKAGIPPEERARLFDIDYALITREDPEVMQTVTDFIRRCMRA